MKDIIYKKIGIYFFSPDSNENKKCPDCFGTFFFVMYSGNYHW